MGIQNLIMTPIGRLISLAFIFAVFTLLIGGINGWFLITTDSGVVNGERVDRLVGFAADENADDAWANVTLDKAGAVITDGNFMKIKEHTGGLCIVDTTGTLAGNAEGFSPRGTAINTTIGVVDGCKWVEAAKFWSASGLGAVIQLILRGAALGGPMGALIALASFGNSFIAKVGLNPMVGAIALVLVILLAGSLLDVLTPFVDVAFESANGNRFTVYESGIGTLSTILTNFYGVVIVGGLLFVAWQMVSLFRSSNSGNIFATGGGVGGRM